MINYNFSSKFRYANILSLTLFFISIIFIAFKGLNYGIDFKGGTLIELRTENIEASSIRDVLKNMELGDINVKKFGKEGDFLITLVIEIVTTLFTAYFIARHLTSLIVLITKNKEIKI